MSLVTSGAHSDPKSSGFSCDSAQSVWSDLFPLAAFVNEMDVARA